MERRELITSREYWIEKISNELFNAGIVTDKCDAYAEKVVDEYFMNVIAELNEPDWIPYDFKIIESRPKEYGRYWVYRKADKQHYEIWNGNGWAYNNNDITHYMLLPKTPKQKI